MISVKFKKVSGKLVAFKISGHAGFAEHGSDIVCSGVSAITYTIINGITEILKLDPMVEVKDGFSRVSLQELSTTEIEKCQVLMETMLLGIESMKVQYGTYITLKIEEV